MHLFDSTASSIIGLISIILVGLMLYNSYKIAKLKGRSPELWIILTFCFGIFALITLLLLPKKEAKEPQKKLASEGHDAKVMHSESAMPLDNEESFSTPRAPRLPGSKSLSWYYADQKNGNDIKGPFSINDLRKQILEHKLDVSTYVWCEEFEEWMQIAEFSNSSLIMDKDFIE